MKELFLLLFLLAALSIQAQNRPENICGEYTYQAPSTISVEEAKKIAVDRARLAALADKYGTIIQQNASTVIQNINGESKVDYQSFNASEVRGEWLEDIQTPEIKISYEKGMLVVYSKVCGKSRELIQTPVSFNVWLLRNGITVKNESNKFVHGDDFYLMFQSPSSGYLAVYLVDGNQKAYCLLPYMRDISGQQQVQNGEKYLFFNINNALPGQKNIVDELSLTADNEIDYNQIYVIFSPNSFYKANDNLTNQSLPRELTFAAFQKWLNQNRNMDKDMQVLNQPIEIRKKSF